MTDRHANASEAEQKEEEKKFKEVGEAYAVLSDQKKRMRYDQGHDLEDLDGHGHGFGKFFHESVHCQYGGNNQAFCDWINIWKSREQNLRYILLINISLLE